MKDPIPSWLSNLSADERSRALARFQTIRPFLEEGIALSQIARVLEINHVARITLQVIESARSSLVIGTE